MSEFTPKEILEKVNTFYKVEKLSGDDFIELHLLRSQGVVIQCEMESFMRTVDNIINDIDDVFEREKDKYNKIALNTKCEDL